MPPGASACPSIVRQGLNHSRPAQRSLPVLQWLRERSDLGENRVIYAVRDHLDQLGPALYALRRIYDTVPPDVRVDARQAGQAAADMFPYRDWRTSIIQPQMAATAAALSIPPQYDPDGQLEPYRRLWADVADASKWPRAVGPYLREVAIAAAIALVFAVLLPVLLLPILGLWVLFVGWEGAGAVRPAVRGNTGAATFSLEELEESTSSYLSRHAPSRPLGVIHLANALGAPVCGRREPGDSITHYGVPTCPRCKGKGLWGKVQAHPAVFYGPWSRRR
jgi:hypothetical protein